jgi:hypothetical protein
LKSNKDDDDGPMTTGGVLFARVLVAEALGRVALAVALARRDPDDRERLIAEIRGGLTVEITGEDAAEVRKVRDEMHRRFAIEMQQVEMLIEDPEAGPPDGRYQA